ncbi:helix-turn-helix transcriptional regulator [Mucilaginibacter sp. HC2]|uniref:winged helix-turn-helix transcriptional regulator n=1 Tax=Mucilaginibacter inviolabilis TaxID=2714892 RepID=UPI00140E4849|nr:helix-turn-helix domain-containing protein [Mucilaginibacter inviolabilis]NHA05444.1 helix-turn-helix transcriptional regulator [Mucilaginibacter inviolabilis]
MPQKKEKTELPVVCKVKMRSVRDTMDILSGKWKIQIIATLAFGSNYFMNLQRQIDGIGSKMLSKELQELEANGLVKRIVYDTKPVTVQYELTDYGNTIIPIINEIAAWGGAHRAKILQD